MYLYVIQISLHCNLGCVAKNTGNSICLRKTFYKIVSEIVENLLRYLLFSRLEHDAGNVRIICTFLLFLPFEDSRAVFFFENEDELQIVSAISFDCMRLVGRLETLKIVTPTGV